MAKQAKRDGGGAGTGGGESSRSSSSSSSASDNAHTPSNLMAATAGALAGAISRFVVGPLDVLKIRFQVQIEPIGGGVATHSHYTSLRQALVTIVKEEGVKGLWRGTVPGQLLTIPYCAVQFVALQQCRAWADAHGLGRHPTWQHAVSFVSGAAAGAAGTVASYPFDLLRTTLAAQGEPKVYKGMVDAARGIVREHGVKGLYRGLGVTVLEIIPYAALQFGLYDLFMAAYSEARGTLHRRRQALGHIPLDEPLPPPGSLQAFVCGLAAGTLAKMGTHPLDVVKKRFQVAGLQRSTRYGRRVPLDAARSLLLCMQDLWAQEGLKGLYKGAAPSILKAAPSAAVTFAAYDLILRLLVATTSAAQQQGQRTAAGQAKQQQQERRRPVH